MVPGPDIVIFEGVFEFLEVVWDALCCKYSVLLVPHGLLANKTTASKGVVTSCLWSHVPPPCRLALHYRVLLIFYLENVPVIFTNGRPLLLDLGETSVKHFLVVDFQELRFLENLLIAWLFT